MSEYTALCPSCRKQKRSAALSSDGLCDECAGRPPRGVTYEEYCKLTGTTTDEMAEAQEMADAEGWEA